MSDKYMVLDSLLIQTEAMQRIISDGHRKIIPEAGFEKIWEAMGSLAEEIRIKMREVRFGCDITDAQS